MKLDVIPWSRKALACGFLPLAVLGLFALDKKEYKVIIVLDTLSPWAVGIQDGFRETLENIWP